MFGCIVRTSGEHPGEILFHGTKSVVILTASWSHLIGIVFACMLDGIIWVRKHNRLVTCGGDDLALVWFCVQTLLQVHFSVVHLDCLGWPIQKFYWTLWVYEVCDYTVYQDLLIK